MKLVIDIRSPQALLAELETLEFRLKRAVDERDFRHVHTQLNMMRDSIRQDQVAELVRARFYFVRGISYAKPARVHKAGFLHRSSTECLVYALELFEDAQNAVHLAANDSSWTPSLRRLEQDCVHEAAIALMVLRQWGSAPDNYRLDLSPLSTDEQRKIKKALKHHYAISSRF